MRELMLQIFNMSVTASIMIGLVLVIRLLLRRAPRVFSYLLWGIVLFRLLCPVSFSSSLSVLNLVRFSAEQTGEMQYITQTEGSLPSLQDRFGDGADPDRTVADPPEDRSGFGEFREDHWQGQGTQSFESPIPEKCVTDLMVSIFAVIWTAGMACLFVVNAAGYLRIRRRVDSAMKLRGNIYLADEIATPFCIGIVTPKIYLPSYLDGEEMEYIILHEQHHIKRGDHVVKLIAFLALCIHWFNPLVWIAFALAGKDMEMSCDEAVMRKMGGDVRARYSELLLQMAVGKHIFRASPLAFGEGSPKERIKHIMSYQKPEFWIVASTVLVCAFAAVCLMTDPKTEAAGRPDLNEKGSVAAKDRDTDIPETGGSGSSIDGTGSEETDPAGEPDAGDASLPGGESRDQKLAENCYREIVQKAAAVLEHPGRYVNCRDAEGNALLSTEFRGGKDQQYQILGYLIQDINGDGVEELLLGENDPVPDGGYDGIIYDMYTVKGGKLLHVFSGWSRCRYQLTESGEIVNFWSSSAFDWGYHIYTFDGEKLVLTKEQAGKEIGQDYRILYPEFISFASVSPEIGSIGGAGQEADPKKGEEEARNAYGEFLAGDFSRLTDPVLGSELKEVVFPHSELEYAMLDLDRDGVSELLVQWTGNPGYYNAVFHYDGGRMICWNNDEVEMSCYDYPLRDGTMVRQYDFSGNRSYMLFHYNSWGEVIEEMYLAACEEPMNEFGQNAYPFYVVDGQELSEEEFRRELEERINSKMLPREAWTDL